MQRTTQKYNWGIPDFLNTCKLKHLSIIPICVFSP